MRLILILSISLFNCTHRNVVNADNTMATRLSNWLDKETIKPISANSHIIAELYSNKNIDAKHFGIVLLQ